MEIQRLMDFAEYLEMHNDLIVCPVPGRTGNRANPPMLESVLTQLPIAFGNIWNMIGNTPKLRAYPHLSTRMNVMLFFNLPPEVMDYIFCNDSTSPLTDNQETVRQVIIKIRSLHRSITQRQNGIQMLTEH